MYTVGHTLIFIIIVLNFILRVKGNSRPFFEQFVVVKNGCTCFVFQTYYIFFLDSEQYTVQ